MACCGATVGTGSGGVSFSSLTVWVTVSVDMVTFLCLSDTQQMERVPDLFKHLRPQLYYFSNTALRLSINVASTRGDNPSTTRVTPLALG